MGKLTEKEIVKFENLSKPEKFQKFYDYRPFVENMISKSGICGLSYKDKKDITQEVFCKVWINIGKYDIRISNITTYLKYIVKTILYLNFKSINRNKRKGQTTSINTEDRKLSKELSIMGSEIDKLESLSIVDNIFNVITDREKDILEKRFYQGNTLEEIGDSLDLTRQRVQQIIGNVKRKLRDEIKEVL